MRMGLWMVAAIAATILVAGCNKSADEEYTPGFVPRKFTFEGKIEPQYVGNWKSSDGTSNLDIVKDGTLKIETTTRSVAGKNVSKIDGLWLTKGSTLMFRYAIGSQEPTVLKYIATLSGNNLVLLQDGGHVKTTYARR